MNGPASSPRRPPPGGNGAPVQAGGENTNFLAILPRLAFFQLGRFAAGESERAWGQIPEGMGGVPRREGIEGRFDCFAHAHAADPGVRFLQTAVSYAQDHLGMEPGTFIHDMCRAVLGCEYPAPGRMLPLVETIVDQYIRKEMIDLHPFAGEFDLFATEGDAAAMGYLFHALRQNRILNPGNRIAMGQPMPAPFNTMPRMDDYRLESVDIDADQAEHWQYPNTELDKLLDPEVKAFFLVNPSTPSSVKLSDDNLRRLQKIVSVRSDLLIITVDAYGTFADNFTSLFAACPQNTILVYSFSKYFGAAGWRMGVVAMHRHNVVDTLLARLPETDRKALRQRYVSITVGAEPPSFLDRIAAESRSVAFYGTAGLATPVQVQMALFCLYALVDGRDAYKHAVKRLLRQRGERLYNGFGGQQPQDPDDAGYYRLLDLEAIYRQCYGEEFVQWLARSMKPDEIFFRLAADSGVVLPPSGNPGSAIPSLRISMASLNEAEYRKIGTAVAALGRELYDTFRKPRKIKVS